MAFKESNLAANKPDKKKPEPFEPLEAEDVTDEAEDIRPPRAKRRRFVTKEGREVKGSTPESRAKFEAERAAERAELEQIRQDVEKRLEAIEHRIIENREAADKAVKQRADTEMIHALRMGAIDAAAAKRKQEDEATHEWRSAPLREVAREYGREEGMAEVMRAEGRFAEDMEFDEKGRVTGLKNVPEVTAGAAFRANAPAMRKIIEDRAWAERMLSGGWKRRRMRQLDADAANWRDVYDNANEQLSYGVPAEDVFVENPFYRQVEDVSIEGMDQQEIETLVVSPEEVLDQKYDQLKAEGEAVDRAIASVEQMQADIEAFIAGEQRKVDLNQNLVSFYEQSTEQLKAELERLEADHDLNHEMQQPENLDIHGKRLRNKIDMALGMVETKQKELKTFSKDGAVVKTLQQEMKGYEDEAVQAKAELAAWEADPARETAMKYRREALQADAADLSDRIMEIKKEIEDNDRIIPRLEGALGRKLEAFDAQLIGENLDLVEDAHAYLIREKALIADKRADVLRARMQMEAEKLGVEDEIETPEERLAEAA